MDCLKKQKREGAGRRALQYSIKADYLIVPPVPALAVLFDGPPFKAEFIYPLKRFLKKSMSFDGAVRLDDAEGGKEEGA